MGRLSKEQYLAWPSDKVAPDFKADEVGSEAAQKHMTPAMIAGVYVLNKSRAKDSAYAKGFALLRVGMLMAGFYPTATDKEVVKVDPAPQQDIVGAMASDSGWIIENMDLYQRAGYNLPFASEQIFRILGPPPSLLFAHHQLSSAEQLNNQSIYRLGFVGQPTSSLFFILKLFYRRT